jgi:hypothetical protein
VSRISGSPPFRVATRSAGGVSREGGAELIGDRHRGAPLFDRHSGVDVGHQRDPPELEPAPEHRDLSPFGRQRELRADPAPATSSDPLRPSTGNSADQGPDS